MRPGPDTRAPIDADVGAAACFDVDDAVYRFAEALQRPPMTLPAAVAWHEYGADAWTRCRNPIVMMGVLAHADLPAAVQLAATITRRVLRWVPAEETRPLEAIKAAEAWARDPSLTAGPMRAGAGARDVAIEYASTCAGRPSARSAARAARGVAYAAAVVGDHCKAAALLMAAVLNAAEAHAYGALSLEPAPRGGDPLLIALRDEYSAVADLIRLHAACPPVLP